MEVCDDLSDRNIWQGHRFVFSSVVFVSIKFFETTMALLFIRRFCSPKDMGERVLAD